MGKSTEHEVRVDGHVIPRGSKVLHVLKKPGEKGEPLAPPTRAHINDSGLGLSSPKMGTEHAASAQAAEK